MVAVAHERRRVVRKKRKKWEEWEGEGVDTFEAEEVDVEMGDHKEDRRHMDILDGRGEAEQQPSIPMEKEIGQHVENGMEDVEDYFSSEFEVEDEDEENEVDVEAERDAFMAQMFLYHNRDDIQEEVGIVRAQVNIFELHQQVRARTAFIIYTDVQTWPEIAGGMCIVLPQDDRTAFAGIKKDLELQLKGNFDVIFCTNVRHSRKLVISSPCHTCGRQIQPGLLWELVVSRGGYATVELANQWDLIASELGIDEQDSNWIAVSLEKDTAFNEDKKDVHGHEPLAIKIVNMVIALGGASAIDERNEDDWTRVVSEAWRSSEGQDWDDMAEEIECGTRHRKIAHDLLDDNPGSLLEVCRRRVQELDGIFSKGLVHLSVERTGEGFRNTIVVFGAVQ
ncbi:hypothetical protein PRZ48_008815 [Zasmidium cellare]|uniref:ARID domain-containing protein n=1 Tax=Zasmidium cellare TaxID=395010 RepID=A0ABR0EGI9_ZASCE|nr:hypothetical protein PRZ48_008815 [Zasmidium cellare]